MLINLKVKFKSEKMYISIIISKKYSETKATSKHTPTHRLASTVTHVHRYIAQAVAVMESYFALIVHGKDKTFQTGVAV